ncbi:metal-dependent transcriptional regulator [Methanococcoides methylutens]|uniref:Iron-dependent repressor IdeR/DtxR n=1 Tax=Methanococcoides methylutens MM1 TaxID=1434104 RepID=A0A0E3STF5_METMT|nr:metal-dependent transcriptional regulator [Methanococcoides methylutens]AKB86083.1 Iron-dependent repressor IdeR/DtxR [Methanococcoides methylutens MM1]
MTTERTEDYLKAIDTVIEKKGYSQVKDIARFLNVSPSSVTGMFKKLTKEGYINYEKYGGVTLTPEGKKLARSTKEKYSVLHEFLILLGVDEVTADDDACKMEHAVTLQTLEKLTKFSEFVNSKEEMPKFFLHFKEFCEKGEISDCKKKDKTISLDKQTRKACK